MRREDLLRAIRQQPLLVHAVPREQRRRAVGVPKVRHRHVRVAGPGVGDGAVLVVEGRLRAVGVVVVAVVEVAQAAIEPPAEGNVVRRRVARIPLRSTAMAG